MKQTQEGKLIKRILKKYPNSQFGRRSDGRLEWFCEHGIGHTISVPEEYKDESAWWIHGCDGCCNKLKIHKHNKHK